jgi:hypothetical protein
LPLLTAFLIWQVDQLLPLVSRYGQMEDALLSMVRRRPLRISSRRSRLGDLISEISSRRDIISEI